MIQSYKDLEVYKRSFKLAMNIFWLTREFPKEDKEEMFSLTSQMVRSSRSISANISEGWAKRAYEQVFRQHLMHSLGSCSETENWLSFAQNCNYLSNESYKRMNSEIDVIGKMLNGLYKNWRSYEK